MSGNLRQGELEMARMLQASRAAAVGGPSSVLAAIAVSEQAIEAHASLDLQNPDYRDRLAVCWAQKGFLLWQMGDTASMHAGLAAYEKAIEFRVPLDLDTPDYRDRLASCWVQQGFLLRQLGDAASLQAGLAAFDRAIELWEPLVLDNRDYRNRLASCWAEKGNFLRQIGDVASLQVGLAAFEKAIELRMPLDPDNPDCRDRLASFWVNKGNLLQQLGDAASLRAGLAAYEKAIELRGPLDLGNPDFRNQLALSWANMANLLRQMDDANSLKASLAAYENAIELRVPLNLDNPEYRDRLAWCWADKGSLLRQLGDAVSLRAGLAAYEKAIELRGPLDLDNPDYRIRLALCWTQKGRLLSEFAFIAPDLRSAAQAFETAHELFAPLVIFPSPFHVQAARHFGELTFYHVRHELPTDKEAAADLCDHGLQIYRQFEQVGHLDQRRNRESLFQLALNAYLNAGAFGAIGEVISDDLDPHKPGSAVDSAAMHEAANGALKFVFDLASSQMASSEGANWFNLLNKVIRTQKELADVRLRQFAGSAMLARLNAEQERAAGRIDEAERIYNRQIEYRPTDPQGYLFRGEFFLSCRRREEAERDILTAGRLTVRAGEGDAVHSAPRAAQIGAMLLKLKLEDLTQNLPPRAVGKAVALTAAFDDLLTWLERALPEGWIEGLDAASREVWRQELPERLREQWQQAASLRAMFFEKQDQELRQAVRQQVAEQIELCRGVLLMSPQPWRDFVDEILAALAIGVRAAEGWAEAQREDYLLETIENALKRATARVSVSDLAPELERIDSVRGPRGAALTDEERRYLACTLRCREDEVTAKFAAIELGCAVEWSIVNRFLAPLRTAHMQHGYKLSAPARKEDQYAGGAVFGYLTGQETKLYLGHLIGGFGKIARRLDMSEPDDFFGSLASWLVRQPNGQSLRDVSMERWRRRDAALQLLVPLRNATGHVQHKPGATAAAASEIDRLWQELVEVEDDAFFQYFPAVFQHSP